MNGLCKPEELERPRPIRRRLDHRTVTAIERYRNSGFPQRPIHLFLVDDADEKRTAIACGTEALGDWITGGLDQVTCEECLNTRKETQRCSRP